MNINGKIVFGILLMLVLIVGCSSQNTHGTTDAVSILFVGNSHVRTGNVPGQLQALARLHGIEMTYVDVSRNGVNLDGAMRDNAIREMQNRNFDYVVIQARGRSLIDDIDWFLSDIDFFSRQVRESGAIPVLYSPAWANVNGQPNEELQAFLTETHKQAAYENDIILVNAGDAWVYAYRTISELSLYARDGIHANHEGAFLTASVFMATLFDLHIENIPTGSIIDDVPMLNILTIAGLVATVILIVYRFVRKQHLYLKKSLLVIISLTLLKIMSFFPHVFRFTEEGNRLLLLYSIVFCLLVVSLCSAYHLVRIKFIEAQLSNVPSKYIFYILVCCVIYSVTLIPALELRLLLYRGDNAVTLAQSVISFFDQF